MRKAKKIFSKAVEITVKPAIKKTKRRLGILKGKVKIAEDFDAPLPNKILDVFNS